jgi:hypothetical protein
VEIEAFVTEFSQTWELYSGLFIGTPYGLAHVLMSIDSDGAWADQNAPARQHVIQVEYRPHSPISLDGVVAAALRLDYTSITVEYCACRSVLTLTAASAQYKAPPINESQVTTCSADFQAPPNFISPISILQPLDTLTDPPLSKDNDVSPDVGGSGDGSGHMREAGKTSAKQWKHAKSGKLTNAAHQEGQKSAKQWKHAKSGKLTNAAHQEGQKSAKQWKHAKSGKLMNAAHQEGGRNAIASVVGIAGVVGVMVAIIAKSHRQRIRELSAWSSGSAVPVIIVDESTHLISRT